MDFDNLGNVMRRLALEAGAEIMKIYEADDFEVRTKSDTSPVTEADEAADALIAEGLRAAFPGVPLVTEEQADTHGQMVRSFLIVDPLDGTKEFVQRRGDFTVNIAYVQDGVPVRSLQLVDSGGRFVRVLVYGRHVDSTTLVSLNSVIIFFAFALAGLGAVPGQLCVFDEAHVIGLGPTAAPPPARTLLPLQA